MRTIHTLLFWAILLGLIGLDFSSLDRARVEPPLIMLGSGQASSGGHCSGR
ncbi:MAG: hypothetical protein O2848_01545 [Proteobacteria bacterium]|nr:hypothetical protein [Pseudomonadota bacterium]MDA0847197.1 hypothetical protein [Pseudomonadota bacterium]